MPATPANDLHITTAGIVTFDGTATFSAVTTTQYDVLVGGASNGIANVGPGSSGQVLQSGGNSANPAYSTSTYPATNAVSTLLYASSANVMSALATDNNGVLITSATGVPSILAAGTTGQVLTATTGSPPSWASAGAAGVSVASVTLTSSQIQNLVATPITLVPAPGAGKVLVPLTMSLKFTYGGTNPFTASSANIAISYSTILTFGFNTANILPSGMLNSTANKYTVYPFNAGNYINQTAANLENVAIVIYNAGGAVTGNAALDNTVTFWLAYYTIT